jgi:hypothetical protein
MRTVPRIARLRAQALRADGLHKQGIASRLKLRMLLSVFFLATNIAGDIHFMIGHSLAKSSHVRAALAAIRICRTSAWYEVRDYSWGR